jgi:hypothetical protein
MLEFIKDIFKKEAVHEIFMRWDYFDAHYFS